MHGSNNDMIHQKASIANSIAPSASRFSLIASVAAAGSPSAAPDWAALGGSAARPHPAARARLGSLPRRAPALQGGAL